MNYRGALGALGALNSDLLADVSNYGPATAIFAQLSKSADRSRISRQIRPPKHRVRLQQR